jgi:hypothetical protein
MGMFDSVRTSCPKCNSPLEYQSKAGECLLNDYHLDNVPLNIAVSIDGDIEYCVECDSSWKAVIDAEPPPETLKMRLEKL